VKQKDPEEATVLSSPSFSMQANVIKITCLDLSGNVSDEL
jgi:hypothetical protein